MDVTKVKYVRVHVRRSELHTTETAVPLWELPVLQAVHGDVTVIGETLVEREPPSASEEFERLLKRYKQSRTDDGALSLPYVATVYGQFGVGEKALERAIREATFVDDDDLVGVLVSAGG